MQESKLTHQHDPDNTSLLQQLLAAQDANPKNYLSENDLQAIARRFGVSRSRVYSTASFYSELSLVPRGRHLIRVCVNAPCENEGNREILKSLEKALGIRLGQTTPDSQFTLESVNCLGACYMSPAIKIDDQIFGNLSPDSIQGILTQFTEEAKRGDALCR